MPPPNVLDTWLAGRRFGLVIDAGSSGSRLQIYSWKDPRSAPSSAAQTLPKVEKGAREGEEWVTKVEPGISSFANEPESVAAHLAPLLRHARDHIPPSLHAETPLFLLATAGMRLLTPEKQAELLHETCLFLRSHSHFRIDDPSEVGPCGSSVRIITGEEEGLFGWIAVNYLMDGFTGTRAARTTYGFLDMGGASTQIAFEPSNAHRGDARNLVDVRLRLLGGEEIHHQVFVTTWLGYGTNQARERYVGQAVSEHERGGAEHDTIPDPCLPKDLKLTETPMYAGHASSHMRKSHTLIGTGSFEQCMQKTSALLNKSAPCPDSPCLFNGVHVPPIDFSVSHFIGVSEYWYSSEHVFGLGGPYDFVQYERAASQFCSREWPSIVKEHEVSRAQSPSRTGGDGEVEQDGKIVAIGKWGDQVSLSRLEMQCFKAAWIANVLHEGIGMPRIVDQGGNSTTEGDKVAEQAENKGLGRPTFQSVEAVGDIAISWTLGKMVLEASKEVPPKYKTAKPIVDPVEDMPLSSNSPIKPIRPPFLNISAIEEKLSHHLPSSLSRSSLGFSPVVFLFYVVLSLTFVAIFYRLCRRQARLTYRRLVRNARRSADGYLMEEGKIGNGSSSRPSSRPPSPTGSPAKWLYPFRRIVPGSAPRPRPPPISTSSTQGAFVPTRFVSPTRSYSLPNGAHIAPTASSTQYASRASSPLPSPGALYEDGGSPKALAGSIASLTSSAARSRNASQLNLSTVLPRGGAVARVSSALHGGGSGSLRDE